MSDQNQYQNQTSPGSGSFTERIEVAADELVSTIKDLLKEGNVRRVTVRNKDGKKLFSVPMTAGVAVGGVAVLAAPTLAALAAIAALATSTTLEVERTDIVDGGPVVDAQPGPASNAGGSGLDDADISEQMAD